MNLLQNLNAIHGGYNPSRRKAQAPQHTPIGPNAYYCGTDQLCGDDWIELHGVSYTVAADRSSFQTLSLIVMPALVGGYLSILIVKPSLLF